MRWYSRCKQVLFVGTGVAIAFNGVVVAVAPGRMGSTYGLPDDGTVDGDVAVLLRHRAVMLALIGVLLAVSAFRREVRFLAVPAAAVSMATFAGFAFAGDVNDVQRRVAVADVVLLVVLAAAAAAPERRPPARRRGLGAPGLTGRTVRGAR